MSLRIAFRLSDADSSWNRQHFRNANATVSTRRQRPSPRGSTLHRSMQRLTPFSPLSPPRRVLRNATHSPRISLLRSGRPATRTRGCIARCVRRIFLHYVIFACVRNTSSMLWQSATAAPYPRFQNSSPTLRLVQRDGLRFVISLSLCFHFTSAN